MVDADDPKYFHVYDCDTGEMEAIRNPYTMYEKIVYSKGFSDDLSKYTGKIIKLTVEDRGETKDYEKFISMLQDTNPADLKILEESFEYKEDNTTDGVSVELGMDDTLGIINNYIDGIENINSDSIKSIFNNLYTEARI